MGFILALPGIAEQKKIKIVQLCYISCGLDTQNVNALKSVTKYINDLYGRLNYNIAFTGDIL